jgi:nucleoredoxin
MTVFDFTEMFGDTLLTKDGKKSTTELLSDKYVMIYFSAHWCPPCRGFTPKLCDFYKQLKASRSDFECVFVSSDRDEGAFDEYYNEMPFLALPYSERDLKGKLSKKFKVNGIPTLVVVGSDGELITSDGRSKVMEDSKGDNFPWIPPTFEEVFPETLTSKAGDFPSSDLDSKFLMMYFSAHWCGPCRSFTPELVKVYNKLKESRDDFDLVFVSSDSDQAAFDEYYGEMPWLALPYSNRDAKSSLSEIFGVEGIPSLIVLGPKVDGKREIINKSARGCASLDNVVEFPWYPQPFADISKTVECNGSDINESPSVVVLCEGADDDEQKEIKDAIKAVATKQPKGGDMLFFYGCDSNGPVPRVRQLCNLEKDMETVMILLDIPDNGGFYVSTETDITADNIEKFIADRGERKQLG